MSVDSLDALTGGVFNAPTSGERVARVKDWLLTQPELDVLNDVHRELAQRDKGAARLLKDRMDELRRIRSQEGLAADWAAKAQALLAADRFHVADALAWLRDAAKAGAPLSREPLSALKLTLNERLRAIDDVQHRVQVAREAAVLLAQRIEVLSTKPLTDALAVRDALAADVARWSGDAQALAQDPQFAHLDVKYVNMRAAAQSQLHLVWEAFDAALQQAQAALADATAPCPAVPVWADDIRRSRGEPVAAQAPASAGAAPDHAARRAAAEQIVQAAAAELAAAFQQQVAAKVLQRQAADLRVLLKAHGRWLEPQRLAETQALVAQVADQQGAQRAQADLARQDLIARAEALTQEDPATGQRLAGRKLQDALKALREQWKQVDRSGAPAQQGLWRRFDEACTRAHQQVETWLNTLKAESAASRAERVALIEAVQAWQVEQATDTRWREQARALHGFAEAWRNAGHLGEKSFAELQPRWKAAMDAARAPLAAAQAANRREREALIQQAQALAAEPLLRLDAVRALQQSWQALAQAVPLDRKAEQALWDAFRGPIDEAFKRKDEARSQQAAATSAVDQRVLDAARALDEAVNARDAQRIQAALAALDRAAILDEALAPGAPPAAAPATAGPADAPVAAADAPSTAAVAAPARPVVAVRGDDRPGAKPAPAAAGSRPGRGADTARRGGAADRPARERDGQRGAPAAGWRPGATPERTVRLGDAAFRARRDAADRAQHALRQLAAQAHGAALTQLLAAWSQRQSAQLPSVAELRGRVGAGLRQTWVAALDAPAAGDAAEPLLRLEVAAEVPTPAPWTDQRRAYQLQLLTRRNEPSPAQTWAQDMARLLACPWQAAHEARLQPVLKALLRS
jgi:hypothetical protein